MKERSRANPTRIPADGLFDFAGAVCAAAGMPEPEARLAADTLVQADLWGRQSLGVMRLSWYTARLKAGVCARMARPEIVVDAGGLAVIDGHDGMGQVLAARAMGEGIRRAKGHEVSAVARRNSRHFGTALYFTLMAARAGCVAFRATNASPAMRSPIAHRASASRRPD